MEFLSKFRKFLTEEETVVTQESDKDKILRTTKVPSVLTKLLSSQPELNNKSREELQKIISDIKIISFRPTTFRIIMSNTNFFDLIYDPAPMQTQHPDDYAPADSFTAVVGGRKYKIGNNSQYEQCLDALNKIMRENPIGIPEPAANDEAGAEESSTEDTGDAEEANAPSGNEEEDTNATDTKES